GPPEIDRRGDREARYAAVLVVVAALLRDVVQILKRGDLVLRARARQRDRRHLARVDRREERRIEIARRLQRLAGPPEDEEHATAALLGENPFLLQLSPRPDDVVARRQAVTQRHVLLGQRIHLLGQQVDRGSLRRDHRLEIADGGVVRRAQAVGQRREALDPLAAVAQRTLGLADAGHDIAQLRDERVVRRHGRALARYVQAIVADPRLGELGVDVADEPRADRDLLQQAVLLRIDLLQLGQFALGLRRCSAGGEDKDQRRECEHELLHWNNSPIESGETSFAACLCGFTSVLPATTS